MLILRHFVGFCFFFVASEKWADGTVYLYNFYVIVKHYCHYCLIQTVDFQFKLLPTCKSKIKMIG